MSLLDIRNLEVVYRHRDGRAIHAVDGVTLSVEAGEIVGLVGEPGCGKSSLAYAAVGLKRPAAGQVLFDGQPVHRLGRWARSPRDVRLQLVFQDPFTSLSPRRSVGDQLAEALVTATPHRQQPEPPTHQMMEDLLLRVGLPANVAEHRPDQLSGGERQRVAIARALAADPKVIVLDEPLSAIDPSSQAQVANLLTELAYEQDIGVLLICADLAMVQHLAHRTAIMYLGQVVEMALTAELWSAPLHPYTRALIDAIPHPSGGSHRLPLALAGELPDPTRPPNGCRFHPRCPYVLERCPFNAPEAQSPTPERSVACWLHDPAQPIKPLAERSSV